MTRFEETLQKAGAGLEVRRFPEGTRTAQDAARAIGCEAGQIVKSLVFTADGSPVLVLMGGADRVDLGLLAAEAGGPIGKAGAELVREVTGYAIGGVPPFGHARPLPAYMDRGLMRHALVWAAAGRPDAVFAIAPAQLLELSGSRLADLAEPAREGGSAS